MATITIRELLPSDHRALVFTFRHLSEQSRYQRYFTVKPELPSRDLARLVNVDHWHHEALIAFSPAPRAPIGIARYVRLEEFDVAEVAIEVVDGWQRHGVGSALMAALTQRAVRAGIRRFHMSMLRDNAGARALAKKLGPTTPPAAVFAAAGNVVELSYSLSGASSGPAGSSGAGSPPPSPPSAPTPTGVG
jgi:acetyltransferase